MAFYKLWAAKRASTVIRGITDLSVQGGQNLAVVASDGSPFRSLAAILEARPVFRFTTLEVDALLTLTGATGLAIGASPLELYWAAITDEGTVAATGLKVTISKGMILPGVLSADQGGLARITVEVVGGGTGDASPVAYASGQTVPTADELTEFFTVGSFTVNSSEVTAVQSAQVDFGISAQQHMGDGKVYPQAMSVDAYNPTMRIVTENAAIAATYGIAGDDRTVSLVFRKLDNCGTLAGSGDLTITTDKSLVYLAEQSGSQGDKAKTTLVVQAVKLDGSTHPITIS